MLSLRPLVLLLALSAAPWPLRADFTPVIDQARSTDRLHSVLVLRAGQTVLEHVQGGPGLDQPANIKSVSKTVLSLLIGLAIDRDLIDGPEQTLAELLGDRFPGEATAGSDRITVGHALSLRTGLQSTSGRNYGRWVQSDNWVRHALTRPMVDRPGGRMIYSTGPSHLLSAALMEASGQPSRTLARRWLADLGVSLGFWPNDPQGIGFGGNDMHISPRDLARIGELYRQGGVLDGVRRLSEDWVEASWTSYGTSPWSGDDYGFGWFITEIAEQAAFYGRGYGGQALFVLPASELTIVMTSDPEPPSPGGRHFRRLRELVRSIVAVQSSGRDGA
jgi:CubicO group peptidase (beta-lactamase class C family)